MRCWVGGDEGGGAEMSGWGVGGGGGMRAGMIGWGGGLCGCLRWEAGV